MTTKEAEKQLQKMIKDVRRSVEDAQNGGGKTVAEMRKKHPRK
jgi:hypothetical protein